MSERTLNTLRGPPRPRHAAPPHARRRWRPDHRGHASLRCWATGLVRRRAVPGFLAGHSSNWRSEMLPPDFGRWQAWLRPLSTRLAMSIAGTAHRGRAVAAARRCWRRRTPRRIRRGLSAVRLFLNLLRSIPESSWASSSSPWWVSARCPACWRSACIRSAWSASSSPKAIEHVDPKPIEAARAAGATPFQVIWHAVLPQVMPQLSDITIYRWEYNFRASTVLGVVGAGGIGFELIAALRILE